MKNISTRELQLLELEIAKEIKRVCDKNNIDYFIVDGTLLGAVRHKGFIPWDDDMDIGMTTENYNKFIKIAPEALDSRFFLQNNETDPFCCYMYSKVIMKGTHFYEKVTEHINMCNGIFVDIFPYDLACASKLHMKKMSILGRISLLKHGYNFNAITKKIYVKLLNNIMKNLPVNVSVIDKKLNKYVKSISIEKANKYTYYVERDGQFRGKFVYDKSYFNQFLELQFEDTTFKAPANYHECLCTTYGNYMELPSEEEREKGHFVSKIELDDKYESYFKQ